jgi:hypothetical protein
MKRHPRPSQNNKPKGAKSGLTAKAREIIARTKAARTPTPPEFLVGALHDRVHEDLGPSRPARSVRMKP